ncbi:beta-catenin binding [Homalodisca vitripennis]|nr:beta-catenin binding [Homalodisca vitripennis]
MVISVQPETGEKIIRACASSYAYPTTNNLSQIVDLAAPAMFKGSSPGCPLTQAACGTCSPWSVCEASLMFPGHRCRCRPGYSGPSCSSPTVPSTFLQDSFVKFALNFEPRRFSTTLQLRFRTREETGELFRLVDQHHREYIILQNATGVSTASQSHRLLG